MASSCGQGYCPTLDAASSRGNCQASVRQVEWLGDALDRASTILTMHIVQIAAHRSATPAAGQPTAVRNIGPEQPSTPRGGALKVVMEFETPRTHTER